MEHKTLQCAPSRVVGRTLQKRPLHNDFPFSLSWGKGLERFGFVDELDVVLFDRFDVHLKGTHLNNLQRGVPGIVKRVPGTVWRGRKVCKE